ncbi:MAG: hypothetical protein ABR499_00790 [Gemmatimonadaceae bacterium]
MSARWCGVPLGRMGVMLRSDGVTLHWTSVAGRRELGARCQLAVRRRRVKAQSR